MTTVTREPEIVHWSKHDPLPLFLCRSHDTPTYETAIFRYGRRYPYDTFEAHMTFRCGAHLVYTRTGQQLEAMPPEIYREHLIAFGDLGPLTETERLAAAGRLIISAWERTL